MNPQMRYGHDMIHFDSDDTIVGSITVGISQGFNDPRGEIAYYLGQLLSGRYSLDECAELFSNKSSYTIEQARSIICQLYQNGHIEDALSETSLSELERKRYSRSANYFSWINKNPEPSHWRAQELIRCADVVVLGVGGIGGVVAYHLVANGVRSVTLIDNDHVEISNLNRQFIFSENDIGDPKVIVAARKLSTINSDVQVLPMMKTITSSAEIIELMKPASLLFRCADSPDDMPFWVSDAALRTRTPWIDCSYAGPVIQCCMFIPGKTGCYRCIREAERKRHEAEGHSEIYSDHVPSGNPAFGPIVHMAGSLAAYEGIRFITGLSPRSVGRAIHQNVFEYKDSYAVPVPAVCRHDRDGE